MKVLKAKVNWYESALNRPVVELLVDDNPNEVPHRYEERNGIYYSEVDGMVSFFYYRVPGMGFGGHKFPIMMKDGTEKVLEGPWSSNSAEVNSRGFGPCVECHITDNEKAFDRGYTFYASAITKSLLEEVCQSLGLYCVECDGSFYPSLHPTRMIKPSEVPNEFKEYDCETGSMNRIESF
jgi:hypothetical protein